MTNFAMPTYPPPRHKVRDAALLERKKNEVPVILEGAEHVDRERVLNLLHQVPLRVDVVHLLQLDDLVLLHELHRVHVAVTLVLPVLHASEGTNSESTDLVWFDQVASADLRCFIFFI